MSSQSITYIPYAESIDRNTPRIRSNGFYAPDIVDLFVIYHMVHDPKYGMTTIDSVPALRSYYIVDRTTTHDYIAEVASIHREAKIRPAYLTLFPIRTVRVRRRQR